VADVLAAPVRELAAAELVDALAVDLDAAGGGRIQAADQVQEGGLARTRRTHQRDEVALLDVKVDAVQHLHLFRTALVGLGQAADRYQGCHGLPRCVVWWPGGPGEGDAMRGWFAASRGLSRRADPDRNPIVIPGQARDLFACGTEQISAALAMADPGRAVHSVPVETVAPSASSAGGSTTTVSPGARPETTSRSSPDLAPASTLRSSTLFSAPTTNTASAPSRCTTAAAGTRTPRLGSLPASGAFSRKLTVTPMSGTMRASFSFSATRTLTVALPRSAVGMMAITSAGIFQSGYELSVASTGIFGCTRPM